MLDLNNPAPQPTILNLRSSCPPPPITASVAGRLVVRQAPPRHDGVQAQRRFKQGQVEESFQASGLGSCASSMGRRQHVDVPDTQPHIDGSGTVAATTYQVITNGRRASGGGLNGLPEESVDTPDAGVSLKLIQNYTEVGQLQSTFQTSGNGLLLLPLPVVPSHSWKSVAVDPKDGRTIELDGLVQGRAIIDACGELVEGWAVTSQYTDSAIGQTITYDYAVATQYGGMLVSESLKPAATTQAQGHTVSPPTNGAPWESTLTFQLAQLKPSPEPHLPSKPSQWTASFPPTSARAACVPLAVGVLMLTLVFTQLVLPCGRAGGGGRSGAPALLFQGLVNGTLYALSAVGLVLLCHTQRIVSFAQGALGAVSYVFLLLMIQYTKVPFVISFLVALLLAGFLGALVGVVLLRFFNSSRLF